LLRQVQERYRAHYELLRSSGLYDALVAQGLLVPHDERPLGEAAAPGAAYLLCPERIPFVSMPYEWTFGQRKAAALLTLQVQELALEYGMTLKDASAFNVQVRGVRPVLIEATRSPAEPEPEQAQPTQPAKPAPKPVAVGDLVEPGPGVAPPRMTERPSPRYPPSARRLGKNAIVQLRLLVDENGRVARVETVGNKAGFGFDDAAIDAANRTAWQAATKDGVRVKMWVDLKIEFRP
jgi:TonB family protein